MPENCSAITSTVPSVQATCLPERVGACGVLHLLVRTAL